MEKISFVTVLCQCRMNLEVVLTLMVRNPLVAKRQTGEWANGDSVESGKRKTSLWATDSNLGF
jgi:hypothetical protein